MTALIGCHHITVRVLAAEQEVSASVRKQSAARFLDE